MKKYIIRILRGMALVITYPILLVLYILGILMIAPIHLLINIFFYIKDGIYYDSKETDYYTNIVLDFFMEDMWEKTTKIILGVN